jgi:hypothetical protein
MKTNNACGGVDGNRRGNHRRLLEDPFSGVEFFPYEELPETSTSAHRAA